jgi:hypothetical protein
MLLGSVNVRATRKDGRYKVKEEYNAYRVSLCALSLTHSIAHVLCVYYQRPKCSYCHVCYNFACSPITVILHWWLLP